MLKKTKWTIALIGVLLTAPLAQADLTQRVDHDLFFSYLSNSTPDRFQIAFAALTQPAVDPAPSNPPLSASEQKQLRRYADKLWNREYELRLMKSEHQPKSVTDKQQERIEAAARQYDIRIEDILAQRVANGMEKPAQEESETTQPCNDLSTAAPSTAIPALAEEVAPAIAPIIHSVQAQEDAQNPPESLLVTNAATAEQAIVPAVDQEFLSATASVQSTAPEIVAQAKEIVAQASAQTDQEKAKAIHDWISLNISYDSSALTQHTATPITSVDVLNEKKGVCYGQAILYAALMRAAGVPTKVMSGTVDSSGNPGGATEQHAWTEVLVNGNWKVVDTTWDLALWHYQDGVPVDAPGEKYFEPSTDLASRTYLQGTEVSHQIYSQYVAY